MVLSYTLFLGGGAYAFGVENGKVNKTGGGRRRGGGGLELGVAPNPLYDIL